MSASAITITAIPGVARLSALEIDPQAAAQAYRDRIVGPVRGVLPDTVVKGIEEQLSGACTTEIAAFDEFTALLTDSALTTELRPHHFRHRSHWPHHPAAATAGRVERLSWKKARATPRASAPWLVLKNSAPNTTQAVEALADPQRTRLILVARAQDVHAARSRPHA